VTELMTLSFVKVMFSLIRVVFGTNHRACIAISACNVIVRMRPQGNQCTDSMCGSERQLFCVCLSKVLVCDIC